MRFLQYGRARTYKCLRGTNVDCRGYGSCRCSLTKLTPWGVNEVNCRLDPSPALFLVLVLSCRGLAAATIAFLLGTETAMGGKYASHAVCLHSAFLVACPP